MFVCPGHSPLQMSVATHGRRAVALISTIRRTSILGMSTWTPIFVLPNVTLSTPIESDVAVLVPMSDPRVLSLSGADSAFRIFAGRFTDAFGAAVEPSVLLVHADAHPAFFDVGAISSFRDAIAIATIGYSRALEFLFPRGFRIFYGDSFAFYPWTISMSGTHMTVSSPALRGIHNVEGFRGQASPSLSPIALQENHVDRPLLRELLSRWCRHYGSERPRQDDTALFRSLNMAYHASLMPAAVDATFYDHGRLISLWVSAFEILIHPGPGGKATLKGVFDLLESVKWDSPECADKKYETKYKEEVALRTLASWLYQRLYVCRCKFLHGEQVRQSDFHVPNSSQGVDGYAVIIYRIALTAFLPLAFVRRNSLLSSDVKAIGALLAADMSFADTYAEFERALLTALPPKNQ
jgi:hypothetical protein